MRWLEAPVAAPDLDGGCCNCEEHDRQWRDRASLGVTRGPLVEHPHADAVAAWREKAAQLLTRLILGSIALGGLEALRPVLRRDHSRQVRQLLCREGEQLVARLHGLKRAGRRLAGADQRRHLNAVAVQVADDACLHPEGILKGCNRVLPALPARDEGLVRLAAVAEA